MRSLFWLIVGLTPALLAAGVTMLGAVAMPALLASLLGVPFCSFRGAFGLVDGVVRSPGSNLATGLGTAALFATLNLGLLVLAARRVAFEIGD